MNYNNRRRRPISKNGWLWMLGMMIGIILISFGNSFSDKPLIHSGLITGDSRPKHECPYKDCMWKGERVFTHGCGNCSAGNPCWVLDSIHFMNPDMDYNLCEDMMDSVVDSQNQLELNNQIK